jgi:hypothetical protein
MAGTPTVWGLDRVDVGRFALGNTLLMFVGFALGALIRNTPGAVVAYMIYAFVAPGLLALLAYSQTWFRDARPWVDAEYHQDAPQVGRPRRPARLALTNFRDCGGEGAGPVAGWLAAMLDHAVELAGRSSDGGLVRLWR